jgi:hypothetical protein
LQIRTILDQIDLGAMALPEFQRGYVWNRDQVRGLMHSLYRKHPVGSLLVWVTKTENANARGDGQLTPGSVKLLLDGQQRITSLYGIIRGNPPKFFDGDRNAFTGLYFNLDDESFEFYAPLKMKDNPLWVNVTELMQIGAGEAIKRIVTVSEFQPKFTTYINCLNAIDAIKGIDLHIEEVAGEDKTVDVVVDIFNQVNRGGTKLSKGDLALAKICAEWPEARAEMKARLDKWKRAGFDFKLEWLLRCTNAIITGEALFTFLKDVSTPAFRDGLQQAEKSVDQILNLISGRLGLDHDRVLGSRYSFPLIARYLVQRGARVADHRERDKLLYWYVHTFLWGRYAGSTETVLNKDLDAIEDLNGALDRLIALLRRDRGDLRLTANDFLGWNMGARFYPLLYMLTRTAHAKDWETGIDLSNHLLGKLNRLEVHHIFPKALLYKNGYAKQDVNALANFTFLTQETNLIVSDRNPVEYLEEYAQRHPGVIASHWIPMDRELWRVENYPAFLDARRELLAKAANEFLDRLLIGEVPDADVTTPVLERTPSEVIVEPEGEEAILKHCNAWVSKLGLPEGELGYELLDPDLNLPLAIIDLAWPNGLQEGYSQPVAILIDEPQTTEEALNRAGFRFFTDIDGFKDYVLREVVASDSNGQGEAERRKLRYLFWEGLLKVTKANISLYANVSPVPGQYIGAGAGKKGLSLNFVVRQHEADIVLYIDRNKDAELNRQLFYSFAAHKAEIENAFGGPLEWLDVEGQQSCLIKKTFTSGGYKDSHRWPDVFEELSDAMARFEKALRPYIDSIPS